MSETNDESLQNALATLDRVNKLINQEEADTPVKKDQPKAPAKGN